MTSGLIGSIHSITLLRLRLRQFSSHYIVRVVIVIAIVRKTKLSDPCDYNYDALTKSYDYVYDFDSHRVLTLLTTTITTLV